MIKHEDLFGDEGSSKQGKFGKPFSNLERGSTRSTLVSENCEL